MLKGERLTQDQINYILHTAVKNKAFPLILNTKPIWYDAHPMMKVLAQFKTWPIQQTNMIWNDVVKYTIKSKDPTRLIGFLVGTLIAGELYNIVRDFLFDDDDSILSQFRQDPSQRQIGKAILNDLLDGGVVGMLADFTYGLYDWATGVSARTGKNIWKTTEYIKESPRLTFQALELLMEKEITPYRQIKRMAEKVDRAVINKDNISRLHYKWRAIGWEWREQKENPSVVDKAKAYSDKVMYGSEEYPVGENTLAYEMASRQIVAGDVDDAAKYLAYILKRADDKDKAWTAIKSSMSTRAPLGKIKGEDASKFLAQFSPEEQAEAKEVHVKYKTMYKQAMNKARDIVKRK